MKKLLVLVFLASVCCNLFAGLEEKVSMDFRDTDVREIFKIIAGKVGMGIVIEKSVRGNMTLTIKDARAEEALDLVTEASGFNWQRRGNNIFVTSRPARERKIKVIPLKHIGVNEAAKILSIAVAGDIKIASCEHIESVVLNGREDALEEAMLIIAQIDKPAEK